MVGEPIIVCFLSEISYRWLVGTFLMGKAGGAHYSPLTLTAFSFSYYSFAFRCNSLYIYLWL